MKNLHWSTYLLLTLLTLVAKATSPPATANHHNTPPQPTPTLSTLLGQDGWDRGASLALTPTNEPILVGYTQSNTWLPNTRTTQHGQDAYLTRLTPNLQNITLNRWFNAQDAGAIDELTAVTTDKTGAIYAIGNIRSADFCQLLGPNIPGHQTTYIGDGDIVALKLNPDGTPIYCTYFGGPDLDTARALTLLPNGSLIIVGSTWSTNIPMPPTTADPTHNGARDILALQLNPSGTAITWATYWGGTGQEEAQAIVRHPLTNNLLIVGWTNATDMPTTPANTLQPSFGGLFDGFLLELDQTGQNAIRSSYWGGPGEERFTAIALDQNNQPYLAGWQAPPVTTGFPTSDALLLNPSQPLSPTLLSGTADDQITALAIDQNNHLWVTGYTRSPNFPTTDNTTHHGREDAFLASFTTALGTPQTSTLWGGTETDRGLALAINQEGHILFTGETRSTDFPTTPNVYQPTRAGSYDIFLTAIQPPTPTHKLYLPILTK